MEFHCIPVDEPRPCIFQVLKEVLASTGVLNSKFKVSQMHQAPLLGDSSHLPNQFLAKVTVLIEQDKQTEI
jgi:hypothetical protein